MPDTLYIAYHYLLVIFHLDSVATFLLYLFPAVIFIELPFYAIIVIYTIRGWLVTHSKSYPTYTPLVSIIVTAYNETYDELLITFKSINEQVYRGPIESLIIVDNGGENRQTVRYVKALVKKYNRSNRRFKLIQKSSRGGLAHSRNLGLQFVKGVLLMAIDADTSIDNTTVQNAAKHFIDNDVVAVSGGLRVRNEKASFWSRMQSIEYLLGINFGRYGLTELGVTNNISGAFGIFRVQLIKQIDGWLNGTAEDLDLMLRLHSYLSRHPQLKIIHEPLAIAWTVVPEGFKDFYKQRLRWDGDLFYIYVRRHWRLFSTQLISFKKFFFFSLYGLYFQLILPFVIIIYLIYLPIKFNAGIFLGVMIFTYMYYLFLGLFGYLLFLFTTSERPWKDIKLIPWLLTFPGYKLLMRILAAYFTCNEIIFKGHKDTTMAPWWIVRKTK